MAKFNGTNTIKTVNKDGHVAYKMSDKAKLVSQVLTTFFNEKKFYGDNSKEIIDLATKLANKEPKFVSNLAVYARKVYHLRSVAHVLTCIVAHEQNSKKFISQTVNGVVERADDLTEIIACYLNMYATQDENGLHIKNLPNSFKKAMSKAMNKFNEFDFAKYKKDDASVKMKDVVKMVHPTPKTDSQGKVFKKILNDALETPITWETELSEKGNTKEVWEGLIEENRVGYMALLRNLRNILNVQPDNLSKVLEKLGSEKEVSKSKQLPFRFYNAYREIESNKYASSKVLDTLEDAMEYAVKNMSKLNGDTAIFIDSSGSMDYKISDKSSTNCYDIAKLLGVLAARICDNATVFTFHSGGYSWYSNTSSNSTEKVNISSRDGILSQVDKKFRRASGGTSMEDPFEYIKKNRMLFDRIIVLSDNEVNGSSRIIQSYADEYRRAFNPDLWVHAIDLQGYGTQQFNGDKTNIISGWSEKVLEFIDIVEKGMEGQVEAIENYDC